MNITEQHVKKLLALIEPGLCGGSGDGTPGNMCVEQAIALAFGERLSYQPNCVQNDIRMISITINDMSDWPSDQIRSKTMRRLAIAQLGSEGVVDGVEWKAKSQPIWDEYEDKRKPIWDEYEEKRKPIWDEYEEKYQPIWNEYEKKRKPIWDEYEEKHKLIWDEYEEKYQPIWDEYKEKHKLIWDEYEDKRKLIWDEYEEKRKLILDEYRNNCLPRLEWLCESLVQLLIALGSPGTKFLYLTEGENA